MWETRVRFLGREDPLEKEMAIHSSTLAWKIPWTEEPDRQQSMGSQRVGPDWATSLSLSLEEAESNNGVISGKGPTLTWFSRRTLQGSRPLHPPPTHTQQLFSPPLVSGSELGNGNGVGMKTPRDFGLPWHGANRVQEPDYSSAKIVVLGAKGHRSWVQGVGAWYDQRDPKAFGCNIDSISFKRTEWFSHENLKYNRFVVQLLRHVRLFVTPWTIALRLPCPSLSPGACSDSCLLSPWCHPTISSSVAPFSSCLQSFPVSGYFPMSQLFVSGGQSTGASASASALPMNSQSWFPLGLTGMISLLFNGLSRVFSSITILRHPLFSAQPSLWSNCHICTWLLGFQI